MNSKKIKPRFVVCVRNDGFKASLDLRKLYKQLPDKKAEADDLIRVIDESGEDYLYPAGCFVAVVRSKSARRVVSLAS